MTRCDRRIFLGAALSLLSGMARAETAAGLFWRATVTGKPSCTLFGYARIAAVIAPDVVADGVRFIEAAHRVVLDIPNMRFPAVPIPNGPLPPLLKRVSASLATRVQTVLAATTPPGPAREMIPGIGFVLLLRGEGQTNPQPTVGGTIADYARGKPVSALVSAEEVKAAWHPPDMVALDARVDEAMLNYLLDLRDRVGPLAG